MGILARITDGIKGRGGKSKTSEAASEHAIDKNVVMRATAPGVFSPTNPGNFESIRTSPILDSPRYFTKDEADVLKKFATEKTEGARQSKRAYKSLGKIEKADAIVHKAHRKYQGEVADNELTKLRSNVRFGKKLHAQRPEYARMGLGLDRAEKSAENRIAQLKAKAKEQY